MTPGIRGKLFLLSFALIVLAVAVADLVLAPRLDAFFTARIREDLFARCALVAGRARAQAAGGGAAWDRLADELGAQAGARVTLVGEGGRVVGDSEVPATGLGALEDHRDRPEVIAALSHGRGEAVRDSATLRRRMMYVAMPGGPGVPVARLAMPLDEVDAALAAMRRILLAGMAAGLLVAVLLSSLAAHLASRSIRHLTGAARRMAQGDLAVRLRPTGRDEVAALGRSLDFLAEGLSRSLGEVREERDRLGAVLAGMREGVLVLDAGDRVRLSNPAVRELLALGEAPEGRRVLEVVRQADLKAMLERAREAGATPWEELEFGAPRVRRVLVRATPLRGGEGDLVVVLVDVTELRRLETLRRDFVANASHELRTPVATLRSAAETLQGAVDDPAAVRTFAEIIERNAERMRALIEDLLDLSRLESSEWRPDLHPVDVAPLAARVLATFTDRAKDRRIALTSEVPAGLAARADPSGLEQALGNLVDNALKYCPEGARITLRAQARGDHVEVAVSDTGPGIAAHHLPRLFERFYRVDAGRSRAVGGTGLGLSIVKHLVESMGGAVTVTSTPGAGSTFTITLPRG